MERRTAWILPFSAGGFLNIGFFSSNFPLSIVEFEFNNVILSIAALVSVLPELVAESDPREALKQVAHLLRKHAYSYSYIFQNYSYFLKKEKLNLKFLMS